MSCTFPDIVVPGETKGRSRRGLNFGKSLAWERLTKGTGSLLPSGLFTETVEGFWRQEVGQGVWGPSLPSEADGASGHQGRTLSWCASGLSILGRMDMLDKRGIQQD